MNHAPVLFLLVSAGAVAAVIVGVLLLEHYRRCYFCWRPSQGSSGVKAGRWAASVAHCEKHTDDATSLAYGRAHLAAERSTRQHPSVSLPAVLP